MRAQFRKYTLPYLATNELIQVRAAIEEYATAGVIMWPIMSQCINEDCFEILRKEMIRVLRSEGFAAKNGLSMRYVSIGLNLHHVEHHRARYIRNIPLVYFYTTSQKR